MKPQPVKFMIALALVSTILCGCDGSFTRSVYLNLPADSASATRSKAETATVDEALAIVGAVAAKHQFAREANTGTKVLGVWTRNVLLTKSERETYGNVKIIVIKRDREVVVSTDFFVGGEDLEVMQQVRRGLVEEFTSRFGRANVRSDGQMPLKVERSSH